jgi:DNA-binding NarL/FixJ family response regulator
LQTDKIDSKKKYGLTTREWEVAELLVKELSVEEISSKLYISLNTVKKHIVNIYKKVGVSSRRELHKLFQ